MFSDVSILLFTEGGNGYPDQVTLRFPSPEPDQIQPGEARGMEVPWLSNLSLPQDCTRPSRGRGWAP